MSPELLVVAGVGLAPLVQARLMTSRGRHTCRAVQARRVRVRLGQHQHRPSPACRRVTPR